MEETVAAWNVIKHEAQSLSPVYISADSVPVFKGCTEWLPFWEQIGREVNRVPVWQREKWQEILTFGKEGNFAVAWVASHQKNETPASR